MMSQPLPRSPVAGLPPSRQAAAESKEAEAEAERAPATETRRAAAAATDCRWGTAKTRFGANTRRAPPLFPALRKVPGHYGRECQPSRPGRRGCGRTKTAPARVCPLRVPSHTIQSCVSGPLGALEQNGAYSGGAPHQVPSPTAEHRDGSRRIKRPPGQPSGTSTPLSLPTRAPQRTHYNPSLHQRATGAMMMNFIRSDPLSDGLISHR